MDIDAALFDVFGTMTDWRSGVSGELASVGERAGLHADWPSVTDDWRRKYVPTLGAVVSGEAPWRSLDELHRVMLDEVLDERGLDAIGDADRERLVSVWHRLRPWPDAPSGLEALHRSPVITAALSNGGVGLLARLTKQAGLRFDCILSAELARTYKPDRRVYLRAAELLGIEPERLVMVACHPDDLEGAAGAGFRTAYIPRPLEWGPEAAPVPAPPGADLVADDVVQLARALAG
ncbi:haloacid dehalogenase type II [Nocardiopsis suaedae]|uniref:Haloacid dehalogenase type II n=1 Tax=Nocardiopsis suaedae TaxID=3018444 RepID=A0ABT4TI44_9ACTN|nr:haloacid dehalogenase type II [Nocardiopsis suaedae]MDA2804036.1 haloacid dehalogenase type II [Nocardiopsis suaedae]